MITLTLLHPSKSVPVQHWTFDNESIIRVGRSTENNVVLYSAVVSRHHFEIRRNGLEWELENFGANGTFIEGKQIDKMPISDGTIVRLATSGPQIQIRIASEDPTKAVSPAQPKRTASVLEEEYHGKKTTVDFNQE